jgi:hypothetical protein
MASTVAMSELGEQFIVALPGASALRFFPLITCPLFSLRQNNRPQTVMRKSQGLAILQVLVSVPLGSSRSAVPSLQLARAS